MSESENESNLGSDNNESGDESLDFEKHKQSLANLKKTDPQFYKFLQENDQKLLQFNSSDDEDGSDDDNKGEEDVEEKFHKPTGKLEVASDESDFEDDDKPKDKRVINLKTLKEWQSQIQTDKSNKSITRLVQGFHAALLHVSSETEEQEFSEFKVEGSAVFNGIIQLCVLELGPAINRFLDLSKKSSNFPHKSKKFPKIKNLLKEYFKDLLKLLNGVTSENIQTVLLKHLHYMSKFLISFPNTSKSLLKRLINIWGNSREEGVKVLAFLCILRITNNQQIKLLQSVLKSMYISYVKNSKFVSLNTLASINFMKRSLIEMFRLDTNLCYQLMFLYIRQLAINLRNAITLKKKENIQSVYNWQFINSLNLFGDLLSATSDNQQLKQLIYPFVQVCLGTIKLIPTVQYYPLRFRVLQILSDLSKNTGVFIPIMPFMLDVLENYNFNKKHKKVSMKPLNFICLLRLSKSQLIENGFKDALIETIYGQLLQYLAYQSHTLAFPDLSFLCSEQVKQFLKKCNNVKYTRKFKQILEKIEENNKFIINERKKMTFNLTDFKQIEGWEMQMKIKSTPLLVFYNNWFELNNIKKNKQLTNNEKLADYKLPEIKKINKKVKKNDGPVELFPSSDEDEDDDVQDYVDSGDDDDHKDEDEQEEEEEDSDDVDDDDDDSVEDDGDEVMDYVDDDSDSDDE